MRQLKAITSVSLQEAVHKLASRNRRKEQLVSLIRTHLARPRAADRRFTASATTTHCNDLAMECFQTVNYAIALMERILEQERGGTAITDAEFIDELEKIDSLTKREALQLRRRIRLRNLVAHEYSTISREELDEMHRFLPSVRSLFR
jgi:hypothetical protein